MAPFDLIEKNGKATFLAFNNSSNGLILVTKGLKNRNGESLNLNYVSKSLVFYIFVKRNGSLRSADEKFVNIRFFDPTFTKVSSFVLVTKLRFVVKTCPKEYPNECLYHPSKENPKYLVLSLSMLTPLSLSLKRCCESAPLNEGFNVHCPSKKDGMALSRHSNEHPNEHPSECLPGHSKEHPKVSQRSTSSRLVRLPSWLLSRLSPSRGTGATTSKEVLKYKVNEHLYENETKATCLIFSSLPNRLYLASLHSYSWCTRLLLARCGDIEANPGPSRIGNRDRVAGALRNGIDDAPVAHGNGRRDEGYVSTGTRNVKSDLSVLTYNVRGLSDSKKVRHIVNNCYKLTKKAANSFFMFQETFVMRLDLLKYLWRGEYHLTPGTGNSCGCLTLVTAPYKIVRAIDIGNRAHIVVLTNNSLNKAEMLVVNIYAPNGYDDAKMTFFEELIDVITENMTSYNCSNVVLAGDFNLVFSEDEIKNRLYSGAERRIAARLKDMLNNLNLEDCWNVASEKSYTWTSNRTGVQAFSTLDRVFFSKDNFCLSGAEADWATSLSDHAAVTARLEVKNVKCNNNSHISRLDPRLLLDAEGRLHLDDRYRELKDQAQADWNPHVRLEYFKMCIRTAANEANGKLKAKIRDSEATVNADINEVVGELMSEDLMADRKTLLMNKLDDLRQIKRNLVEKIGTKLEQRTARKWYNEGELSNKYFFNLLNRKNNDEVSVLLDDNGTEINDPERVESIIKEFYKDLYESVPAVLNDDDDLFRNVPSVSPADADVLTKELTLEELTTTLNTCTDSAPGPDGIPYSFLKYFWSDYGQVLLEAWNYSIRSKELAPSHKVSYLRLIPKAGKDSRVITNLRPITLSNTDHKLVTKTYARKLTNIVSSCIGDEQTAYIPGRLINDNIRSMLMTMDLADVDVNVDGVIVSLDAKKAFDSVDHRFIKRCLKEFGLEQFVPIFDVLYKDLRSDIIINGRIVKGYNILKGVKQGDALSCIIFIMCMEPLIRNIKANRLIRPVASNFLNIAIPNVYGFADDISVLTVNDNLCVQAVFDEYEKFTSASGLYLNADKTEILCFNRRAFQQQVFRINYNGVSHVLRSKEMIKINGIIMLQNSIRREEVNVAAAVESMEKLLKSWSARRLTLVGRILIIKTFAISKLIYIMQSLKLSDNSCKAFIKVAFKFLWNKNYNAARAPERIKRSVMYTSVANGGFGMLDIERLGDSLDLRSHGRLLTSSHPFMSQLRGCINCNDFFNIAYEGHVDLKAKNSLCLINRERRKLLRWPKEILLRDTNFRNMLEDFKLGSLLTNAGRLSIPYFNIRRRCLKVGQLSVVEWGSLSRYMKYPELYAVINGLLNLPGHVRAVQGSFETQEIFPTKSHQVVRLSTLSSKILRLNLMNEDENMICMYKIGMALTPGEVISWTGKLKRLTSTRHKNILLRLVHGDIFSNGRLARFGLRNDPGCANCAELNESILHKVKDCIKANEAWLELNRIKAQLNLESLTDLSIENLVGAKDNLTKIELALNAELIHRLTARNEAFQPKVLVKAVVKLIGNSERLDRTLKDKFNEVLMNWS